MVLVLLLIYVVTVFGNSLGNITHAVLQTECSHGNSRCYNLHQADRAIITWQDAYSYCQDHQDTLATIPDQATQDIMRRLNKVVDTVGDGHAWVAARRSHGSTWYDVTGRTYAGYIQESDKAPEAKCVLLIQNNMTRRWRHLQASKCYTTSVLLTRALCQYTRTAEDKCSGYSNSGMCYVTSASFVRTWYGARMYCMTSYHDGDLAYSSLTSVTLLDYIRETLVDIPGLDRNLWVGVVRNGWKWIQNGVEIAMDYYAWFPDEGAGVDENCLQVDLNAHSRWADKTCNHTSTYFICQYDTPPRSSQGHTLASTSTTRSSTSITQPIARSSQRHTLATTTRSTTSIAPSTYRTRSTVSMKAHSTIAQFTTIRGPVTSRTNGSSVTTTTRHATMQTSHVVTDNDVTTSHVVTDNDVTARGADVNTNAVEITIRDVTSVTPEVAGSEEDTLSSITLVGIVCTVVGLLLVIIITGVIICVTRNRHRGKRRPRSTPTPPGREGDRVQAVRASVLVGDRLSRRSRDNGDISDGISVTAERSLPDGSTMVAEERIRPHTAGHGPLNSSNHTGVRRQYGVTFTPVGGIFSQETSVTTDNDMRRGNGNTGGQATDPMGMDGHTGDNTHNQASDPMGMDGHTGDNTHNHAPDHEIVTIRERASLVRSTEPFVLLPDENENMVATQLVDPVTNGSVQHRRYQESPHYQRTITPANITPRDHKYLHGLHRLQNNRVRSPAVHANTDSRYIVKITVPSQEVNRFNTIHTPAARTAEHTSIADHGSQTFSDFQVADNRKEPVYTIVNKGHRPGQRNTAADVTTSIERATTSSNDVTAADNNTSRSSSDVPRSTGDVTATHNALNTATGDPSNLTDGVHTKTVATSSDSEDLADIANSSPNDEMTLAKELEETLRQFDEIT